MRRPSFVLFWVMVLVVMSAWPGSVVRAETCSCLYEDANGKEKGVVLPAEDTTDAESDADCSLACMTYFDQGNVSGSTSEDIIRGSLGLAAAARAAQDQYNEFVENGQCNCYCGKSGVGATPLGGVFQTAGECRTDCETQNLTFVSCVTSLDQSPLGNQLCFANDECDEIGGEWGEEQPAECESAYHYCYPEAKPITLSVPLGGITTVMDIGTFINAFYSYSLGIAAIIAIVMIMIGGVQYILGGANPELVGAAKTRISNATIGLVILLSAFMILRTVSPYLVYFKSIQLPMIKPSQFLAGSCEDYILKGYTVVSEDEDQVSCGNVGTIVADANGGATTGTCTYNSCAETDSPNGRCTNVGGGYQCLTCGEVTAEQVALGYQANVGSCRVLNPQPSTLEGGRGYRCEFIQDLDFNDAILDKLPGAVVKGSVAAGINCVPCAMALMGFDALKAAAESLNSKVSGSCGLVKLDCSKVTKCSDYDDIQVGTESVDLANLDSLEDLFKDVCENNWCAATVTDGPCGLDTDGLTGTFRYATGVGWLDCESKQPTTATSTLNGVTGSGSRPGRSE